MKVPQQPQKSLVGPIRFELRPQVREIQQLPHSMYRDVTTGATGATSVAPKFSDTLTLSQPRGADCGGRS